MDMFKWVGRKKREEEWMRQPRRVPSFVESLPEDDKRWMVTQEFVNDEDKNLRVYLALWQPDPKVEKWAVYQIEYNLKTDSKNVSLPYPYEFTDPLEVVRMMRSFEQRYRAAETYIQHPESRNSYIPFANKFGIHIDDDGNVFRVKTETPLAKGTFMSRESLDKLFGKVAAKTVPLDTWAGIYEGIVNYRDPEWTVTDRSFGVVQPADGYIKVEADTTQYTSSNWEPPKPVVQPALVAVAPVPAAIEPVAPSPVAPNATEVTKPAAIDGAAVAAPPPVAEEKPAAEPPKPVTIDGKTFEQLAKDKPYAAYPLMQSLVKTRAATQEDVAQAGSYGEYGHVMAQVIDKVKALPAILLDKTTNKYQKERATNIDFAMQGRFLEGRHNLARHAGAATILVGMLRAGVELYKDQFGPGKKFTPEGLALVSDVGSACERFAVKHLGIDPEEAKKISKVIAQGADPNGPDLPLETIFKAHPAPKWEPPIAPAAPTSAGMGTGSHKSVKNKPVKRSSNRW